MKQKQLFDEALFKSTYFGQLSEEEYLAINKSRKEIAFKRKDIIIKEGQGINELIYLKSGVIKISRQLENGKEQILTIAKSNEFIGLLTAFTDTNYQYSITALENCTIYSYKLTTINHIIQENGKFALTLMQQISGLINNIIKNRFSMYNKLLKGRIASVLLFFSEEVYHTNKFIIPLSRKEMASLIDMTPENVIRSLSDFKKENIIHAKTKHIEILNKELLVKISQLG